MIEKLDPIKHTDNLYDRNGFITNVACGGVVIKKVNELIDAVNNQQIQLNNHECRLLDLHNRITALDDPTYHEEPAENVQDKFAEQRKWIGKLCKFWDDEDEGCVYEILIDIEDDGSDYPYKMTDVDSENWTMSYKHCEPVSEDLIYKGE